MKWRAGMAMLLTVTAAAMSTLASEGPLETVTIIGSRDDARMIAGSSAVITDDDLARFQDTDINRVLSQVPGVYLREEDGYGLRPNISIRGTTTERSSRITKRSSLAAASV